MQKFYWFIGKLFLQAVGLVCVVAATSVIVVSYYEEEKEMIFFEMSNYLEAFEESIVDEHTMFDAKDLNIEPVKKI